MPWGGWSGHAVQNCVNVKGPPSLSGPQQRVYRKRINTDYQDTPTDVRVHTKQAALFLGARQLPEVLTSTVTMASVLSQESTRRRLLGPSYHTCTGMLRTACAEAPAALSAAAAGTRSYTLCQIVNMRLCLTKE